MDKYMTFRDTTVHLPSTERITWKIIFTQLFELSKHYGLLDHLANWNIGAITHAWEK